VHFGGGAGARGARRRNPHVQAAIVDVPIRPCSTEATTRPHKKHRAAHEVPFLRVALAIHAEHDRNGAIIRSTVAIQCRFQRIGEIYIEMEASDCSAIKSFLAMREKL
jgi:hypothetical protein